MVEEKYGMKLRRHVAIALLPTAALLLGSSVALATTSIGQEGLGSKAIGGTGIDAIGGTGRFKGRAIGGTGADAIGGTGVNAIGGTGVNAIGGTGVNAIGGTGVNAIGGTGVNAIGGTGVNAIGGTGVNAIGGTGVNAIGGTGVNAIGGTGRMHVMLLGPVEAIDQDQGSITVLGRKLRLPMADESAANILAAYASGTPIQVAVLGTVAKSGKIANLRLQVLPAPYIAGVSEVVLTGAVQAVDAATGRAVVANQTIDINALLDTSAGTMRVGNVVTVRGTMPQVGEAIAAAVLVIHSR